MPSLSIPMLLNTKTGLARMITTHSLTHTWHITFRSPKSTIEPGTLNIERDQELFLPPNPDSGRDQCTVHARGCEMKEKGRRRLKTRKKEREVRHEDIRGYFLQKAAR